MIITVVVVVGLQTSVTRLISIATKRANQDEAHPRRPVSDVQVVTMEFAAPPQQLELVSAV